MKTDRNKRRINDKWLLEELKKKPNYTVMSGLLFFRTTQGFYTTSIPDVMKIQNLYSTKILKKYFKVIGVESKMYEVFNNTREKYMTELV
jgi:hypothetical protein